MTYTATTATGEHLSFDSVTDAIDWAENNVITDWRALSAHRFDDIGADWLPLLTPGQIDDARPLRDFHLVRTDFGAVVCQNDDHAMLVLASEWKLANLSITNPEKWVAPADLAAIQIYLSR